MSSPVHPFRPRIVVSVGRDGSFSFAATSDVEILIVRPGCREFLAHPSVAVGIAPVRKLLETSAPPALHQARWQAAGTDG
jgi:hypothetical protein